MKTLYIEMNSGVAGDMLVGALCDLTGGYDLLRKKLDGLLPGEFETALEPVKKCGIAAKKFQVKLLGQPEGHSHSHGHGTAERMAFHAGDQRIQVGHVQKESEAHRIHGGEKAPGEAVGHHIHDVHDEYGGQDSCHSHGVHTVHPEHSGQGGYAPGAHTHGTHSGYEVPADGEVCNAQGGHGMPGGDAGHHIHSVDGGYRGQGEHHSHRAHPAPSGEERDHSSETHGSHHDHGHTHHHAHRNLADITAILESSSLDDAERELALRILARVARAEAKAHGCAMEEVHFHEVGAVDSIVDIVSAAVLIRLLQPDRILASPFHEGRGFVRCAHGEMPLPAPATAAILAEAGAPLMREELPYELTTPTGAAIVAELAEDYADETLRIQKIGLGAGDRELSRPNVVRLFLCEGEDEGILELCCNIDDCTGELLGYTMERLMEAGALDCFFTPIYMKKSRPAYLLSVLCTRARREELVRLLFRETTTIGVREKSLSRHTMDREPITVETQYGEITGKRCRYGDVEKCYPEYESAAAAARRQGLPLAAVYEAFAKGSER